MSNEKKFRFWLPLDTIKKGKDSKGKEVMILGGIASTKRTDTDGESLDPSGFDISYLTEKGVVNWNHNKSPESIIGEPSNAKITKEGLYVESMLYPESGLAKNVYELAQTLKKSSKTRRLGYSIEGKALQRDPNDPKKVTQALITGLAVTICPKNPDSIVDIIKGEFNDFENDEFAKAETDALLKDFNANGGKTYIIDITRPDGNRITVDCDYNIEIKKDLSTTTGRAVIPESVDNKLKTPLENKYLEKSIVFEKIFERLGVIDLSQANKIFNKINSLQMAKDNSKSNGVTNITDELLEKALDNLGDKLGDKNKEVEKSDDEEETESKDKMKKGKEATTKKDKKMDDSVYQKPDDVDDEEENDDEEEIEKQEKKPMKKSQKIEKGNQDQFADLAVILKGMNDKLNKVIEKQNSFEKSLDDINDSLEQPFPQKSVTKQSTPVKREFEKGIQDEFEKGIQTENVLSASKNKQKVLNILDDLTFEKGGVNAEMAKAMTTFESAGTLEKGIINTIKEKTGISIVS